MITLPPGVQHLQSLFEASEQYYLVGGAVRDALLSKSSHDLDIVCSCDTRSIGRKLADLVSGSFFMLDNDRNACRVLVKENGNTELIFDFTRMRGDTIESDLKERDFTINAMAVDLTNPAMIIDPLQGGRDLAEKWLRPCTESSFETDPLRVIRAIRYSVKYDLKMEPKTINLLKQAVDKLGVVSKERRRDELFKILENDKSSTAIELLKHFEILTYFSLTDIPDFNRAISRLRAFKLLFSGLFTGRNSSNNEHFLLSSFVLGFKYERGFLMDHFGELNQSDRSKKSLDGLLLLLWDVDVVHIDRIVEELALSNEEQMHIVSILENRNAVFDLLSADKNIDNRMFYKFFKPLGNRALDLVFLSIANYAGHLSADINENYWISLLECCQKIIDMWVNHQDVINPKPLINGRDLMFEFDLLQGPIIGQLLDGLCEEQAAGVIQTREEALNWIEIKLQSRLFSR